MSMHYQMAQHLSLATASTANNYNTNHSALCAEPRVSLLLLRLHDHITPHKGNYESVLAW